jgi:hypothetical protein
MTPSEAQKLLLEHGFYGKWEGRRLIGASTYLPGNPGKFEGVHFMLTLLSAGVWEAEVVGFDGIVSRIEKGVYYHEGDSGTNLEAITQGLIHSLQNKLHHLGAQEGIYYGPNPPLWLGVQLGQVAPNAKSDVEALSRLFVSEEQEAELRRSTQLAGLLVVEVPEEQIWTEEMLLGLPLGPVPVPPEPKLIEAERHDFRTRLTNADADAVVIEAQGKAKAQVISPNARSYQGSARGEVLEFCWAPLAEKDSWPTQLKVVHHPLSVPREMTTTLLISALCQIFETKPEWLDLIMFTTEPSEGNLTACFYGSKADLPKREKPEWLVKLVAGITPLSSAESRNFAWRNRIPPAFPTPEKKTHRL